MDYIILILLCFISIYLIIRDRIASKRRKKTYLLLKRISSKIDFVNKTINKQNKLFEKLLDILSDEKDKKD